MVSGSDEHGTPIEIEAVRLGISPKQLTDKIHAQIQENKKKPKKQGRFQKKMAEMMEQAEKQKQIQKKKK